MLLQKEIAEYTIDVTWSRASGRVLALNVVTLTQIHNAFLERCTQNMQINYLFP